MNISFVTFADQRYAPTLERIGNEAKEMNVFSNIYLLSDKDFDNGYKTIFYNQNKNKLFGFGYYCWKSWAVKKAFDNIKENEFLLYADAGCCFNKKGIEELNEWILSIEKNTEKDVIAFIQPEYIEVSYTKEDLFSYFGISKLDRDIRDKGQFFAGVLLLRKTQKTQILINRWYEVSNGDVNLINDNCKMDNEANFISNRYDQSILSLLLKLSNFVCIHSIREIKSSINYPSDISRSPIWVQRHRNVTLKRKIKLLPYIIYNKICILCGFKHKIINLKNIS